MAMPVIPLEETVAAVTRRTAELLRASVTLVGERGDLLARSDSGLEPQPGRPSTRSAEGDAAAFPLTLEGRRVTMLVTGALDGESAPDHLVRAIIDLVVGQIGAPEQLPHYEQLKNSFILKLLRGASGDETEALREAQVLGLELRRPRAVILIDAADYILDPAGAFTRGTEPGENGRCALRTRLIVASLSRSVATPDETICAYLGDGEIAILKERTGEGAAASGEGEEAQDRALSSWAELVPLKRNATDLALRLRQETGAAISAGVGRYHPGIRGLARSYDEAREALLLGRRFQRESPAHALDTLGIVAFAGIANEETRRELAWLLLHPLLHEPELLETLDAFFAEQCSPSATARQLSLHRNTLAYRLEKVTALTGLDPRRFEDAVQLRCALVVHALSNDPIPLCKAPTSDRSPGPTLGKRPMRRATVIS